MISNKQKNLKKSENNGFCLTIATKAQMPIVDLIFTLFTNCTFGLFERKIKIFG